MGARHKQLEDVDRKYRNQATEALSLQVGADSNALRFISNDLVDEADSHGRMEAKSRASVPGYGCLQAFTNRIWHVTRLCALKAWRDYWSPIVASLDLQRAATAHSGSYYEQV